MIWRYRNNSDGGKLENLLRVGKGRKVEEVTRLCNLNSPEDVLLEHNTYIHIFLNIEFSSSCNGKAHRNITVHTTVNGSIRWWLQACTSKKYFHLKGSAHKVLTFLCYQWLLVISYQFRVLFCYAYKNKRNITVALHFINTLKLWETSKKNIHAKRGEIQN